MKKVSNKYQNILKAVHQNKKSFFVLFIFVLFSLMLGFFNSVKSSPLQNMSGYIWGSEQVGGDEPGGVGWISLNCISGGNCGSIDYGVNIDMDGYLRGYAWSSNYGWLKFGGLSEFPSGGGTVPDNARLNGSTITGWARFCAGAASPESCNGFISNLRNGGWDGWVSLSGNSPNYGVSLSGSALSGYAWGGNDNGKNVVGWIDFSQAIYTPVVSPTVTISAIPANIPAGSSVTLNWSGINIETGPNSCTTSGDWGGVQPYPAPSGGVVLGPLATGTYNYSIQCYGPGNVASNISTAVVTVGSSNVLDFYATPSPVYPPYQTTLFWNSVPAGLNSCVADSAPPLNLAPVASWNGGVPDPSASAPVSVPYNPTNFKLTCLDTLSQPVSAVVSVPQGSLPETVSLSSNGVIEAPPLSGDYFTTLTWSTINANNCFASGGWTGSKGNSGSESNIGVPITAPAFTIYSLTCTGIYSGEIITASIQLNEGSDRTFNIKQPKYKEQ